MSKIMRRKHFQKETMDDLSLPSEVQTVVRVKKVQGNNLLLVEEPDESTYLASIPTKFRKNIWVVRGGYALVEPIAEGNKVKAEIVKILQSEDIKYYKQEKVWPEAFQEKKVEKKVPVVDKNSSDDSDDDELFVNTNRLGMSNCDNDSSDIESDSEESDSDFEDAEEDSQDKPSIIQNDAK